MKNNNRLPQGLSDSTGQRLTAEIEVVSKLYAILEEFDYQQVRPAALDFIENLQMEPQSVDSLFKTIDNGGKTLGFARDITPSLIRMTEGDITPQRFFYNMTGYSFFPDNEGRREVKKSGIQIYNVEGFEGETEIITSALDSLKNIGISNVKIVLNSVAIIRNIVKSFNPSLNAEIKDIVSDIENVNSKNLGEACYNIVSGIYRSKGGLKTLEKVTENINNKEALDGIVTIFRIYQILSELGYENNIEFDFGYFNDKVNYYNDTLIRIESQDLVLAEGGRFRGVKYGKLFNAVACNFNMPVLIEYYIQTIKKYPPKEKVLLAVEDSTAAITKYFKIRENLGGQNIKAIPLFKADRKKCESYAQIKAIDNIIYIDADGKVSE